MNTRVCSLGYRHRSGVTRCQPERYVKHKHVTELGDLAYTHLNGSATLCQPLLQRTSAPAHGNTHAIHSLHQRVRCIVRIAQA